MNAMANPHPGETVRFDCVEAAGLTVTEAARRLGCSRPALSRILNGWRPSLPRWRCRWRGRAGATPTSGCDDRRTICRRPDLAVATLPADGVRNDRAARCTVRHRDANRPVARSRTSTWFQPATAVPALNSSVVTALSFVMLSQTASGGCPKTAPICSADPAPREWGPNTLDVLRYRCRSSEPTLGRSTAVRAASRQRRPSRTAPGSYGQPG